ncbi:Transcription factor IWS1 [Dictyocoela roeselum]|nr:Transcription factor IWS1 [Dictyocoela roeselum]
MSTESQPPAIVPKLKEKIYTAVTLDIQNNRHKKPAVHRLEILPHLGIIARADLKKEFLDYGILEELRMLLEPLPDNSFPNVEIKVAVLELLTRLEVRKEHLLDSGIGKIVYFYSRGRLEPKRVRALATELVNRWTRSVINS